LHQFDESVKAMRPIGFFSRKLASSEQNYPVCDKELLAIRAALEHWRYLLIDTEHPVQVQCDHRNLTYFQTTQNLNRRQARWLEFLSDFNFKIVYTPGKEMVVADPLSRSEHFEIAENILNRTILLPSDRFMRAAPSTVDLDVLLAQWEPRKETEGKSPDTASLKDFSPPTSTRLLAPVGESDGPIASPEEIHDEEDNSSEIYLLTHPESATPLNWPLFMVEYISKGSIPDKLPIRFRRLVKLQRSRFTLRRGVLYRKVVLPSGPMAVPYIVPSHRASKLLSFHESFHHLSSPSLFRCLQSMYWWPQMQRDYEEVSKVCTACQLNRSKRDSTLRIPPVHPLEPLAYLSIAGELILYRIYLPIPTGTPKS